MLDYERMSYTNAFNDNNVQSRENEVIEFLKRCQLEQYANVFIEEGFDTMEAVSHCVFYVQIYLSDKS